MKKQDDKKSQEVYNDSMSIGAKDQSFLIFRALGKVLHCKSMYFLKNTFYYFFFRFSFLKTSYECFYHNRHQFY